MKLTSAKQTTKIARKALRTGASRALFQIS
jgi:hypothetical protein